METKSVTYKLAPKGAQMKTGGVLDTLKLKPIDFIIAPEIKPQNTIKIIPTRKEKSNSTELF